MYESGLLQLHKVCWRNVDSLRVKVVVVGGGAQKTDIFRVRAAAGVDVDFRGAQLIALHVASDSQSLI